MSDWFAIWSAWQALLIVARQTRILPKLRGTSRPALRTLFSLLTLLVLPFLLDRFKFCSWTARALAWFADDFRFEDGDEIVLILRSICGR
jgi:hypothetical protein